MFSYLEINHLTDASTEDHIITNTELFYLDYKLLTGLLQCSELGDLVKLIDPTIVNDPNKVKLFSSESSLLSLSQI